jgi:hypothetical protein
MGKAPSNEHLLAKSSKDASDGTWYDWCDKASFAKWSQIYLSCAPVDLPRAREAINRIYRSAELRPPRAFVVCDSPLSAAVARLLLERKRCDNLRPLLGDEIWLSARASVGRTRRKKLEPYLTPPGRYWDTRNGENRLRNSVWEGTWERHHQSVLEERWQRPIVECHGELAQAAFFGALHTLQQAFEPDKPYSDSPWDCWWKTDGWQDRLDMQVTWKYMWESLGYPEGEVLVGSLHEMLFGAHDAAWLMACDSGDQDSGLLETELLAGLQELAQCCGWWAPYKDLVILQHRPLKIDPLKCRRASRQLTPGDIKARGCQHHDHESMAVKYRDGWGWDV